MSKESSSPIIKVLRTPDERFENLKDFPFEANYHFIDGIRMHYIDENKESPNTVVLIHGEPTWTYTFRNIITALKKEGYRVVAPDLIGFGKSDKPINKKDYSYAKTVAWTQQLLLDHLNLTNIHLIVHDWGGLVGLRIAAINHENFSSIVAMNTAFPRLEGINPIYIFWRILNPLVFLLPLSRLFLVGVHDKSKIDNEVLKGYEAPFPDKRYKIGPKTMPGLIPIYPWHKEVWVNRKLWQKLKEFDKPFLTIFSNNDPFTKKVEEKFIRHITGAKNQKHLKINDAGHFLYEDKIDEVTMGIINFIAKINKT